MSLETYEKGSLIEIPVTFTDPATGQEVSGIVDATIQIFMGNTMILGSTPLILISGGRFYYPYTIPLLATSGTYTVYITGTVNTFLQTATMSFAVTDRLTILQTTLDAVKIDIQVNKVDMDNQFSLLQTDVGDPSADGTTLHAELKTIISDIGNPLLTGQDLTTKLDDIRIVLGLGTPAGIVTASGVVLDDNNVPLAGVRVVAIDKVSGKPEDTAITQTLTGAYSLHLNPGTYVLEFIQATTVLQQTLDLVIPTLVVTVTIPNVKLATKRTVTDVVRDLLAVPLEGVLVKAIFSANFDANAANNRVEAAAFTDVNGIFVLQLFPGAYTFQFVKTGFDTLPQVFTVV